MAPADEAALAEAVAEAAAARRPLAIRGGGTRAIGLPVAGAPLETSGLRGVTLYEPGALTLVVRAGTPVAEVEALLAAEGQMLPFEPVDHRPLLGTSGEPTVGGMVATGASGPRRVRVGALRDYVLGVRFVSGEGRIIRAGGRVMKNVTGYDLGRLLAGSHGTLGVLTEVAFKVLPAPERVATLRIEGPGPAEAVALMAAALATPWEVSGAAWLPAGLEGAGAPAAVLLRLEGFAEQIAYRSRRLAEHLAGQAGGARAEILEDDAAERARWRAIRDAAPLAGTEGDLWLLSLRPSTAAGVLERAGARAALMDWGGGRLWLVTEPGDDLRARLGPIEGHATLLRAAPETLARLGPFHPRPPGVARLEAGLRARFDPAGILNPGRMGG
ncbi:MAG: glycolate oxidase subunit GlcE [Alphaproteobacteria bacterium]|nr:MAG: glycolate oxidase subunit GlcE [Alphaproteobacteria bacterium]